MVEILYDDGIVEELMSSNSKYCNDKKRKFEEAGGERMSKEEEKRRPL